ncbi:MAG: hypothetical protein C0622_09465 [Desulfuromonas sp.]|nr:MAG: hypothetical protein C0622_09465 [Desulfuromonas sp.]
MTDTAKIRAQLWDGLMARALEAYRALAATEKEWIAGRLARIAQLQRELDTLFRAGNGLAACHNCGGDCCAKGHNHMTLANLLAFLQDGELPPVADFSLTCPFLGPQGCRLAVERRPYNCVTFICDEIEIALCPDQRRRFYSLDSELRQLYLEFSARYPAAAMTGLLIREQRSPGAPLLQSSTE